MITEKSLKKPFWSSWWIAARPKTLTSALVPVVVGTLLAYSKGVYMNWSIPFFALASALCINIATNLINDSLDFKKGADTHERLGPTRATQSGLLPFAQVYWGGIIFFGLAILFGIPLVIKGGYPLLIVLVASIISGYIYTGGPYPLSYKGLGDFFVFIFFGFVATLSVFYLQTGYLAKEAWLAGAQIGLLDTVLIAINNLRDVAGDAKSNKKTLPVRFGKTFGRLEITFLVMASFLLGFAWLSWGYFYAGILPWLAFPVALRLMRDIWTTEPSRAFNAFLGKASLLLVLFGISLSIGFLLKG